MKHKNKCAIWYCFRKGKNGLQITINNTKEIVAWYCDKHAGIADELFNDKEIKLDIPFNYKKLNKQRRTSCTPLPA